MENNLLMVLVIGLVLGFKHAIEPDHIIAVSTIASQSKKLWRSSLMGLFWGIGHSLTLLAVGLMFLVFKNSISQTWSMSIEFLVGVMLVYLGISTLLTYKKKKIHVHEHEIGGENQHQHFHSHEHNKAHNHQHSKNYLKSMVIGIVHGLAGSAAMIVLTMSTVKGVSEGFLYMLIFGIGTILGMLLFTTLVGIPFVISAHKLRLNNVLVCAAGTFSTIYGFYFMYNLGVIEGLFTLWFSY